MMTRHTRGYDATQAPAPESPLAVMRHHDLETAARIHYSFLPDPIFTEDIDLSIRHRPVQTLGAPGAVDRAI